MHNRPAADHAPCPFLQDPPEYFSHAKGFLVHDDPVPQALLDAARSVDRNFTLEVGAGKDGRSRWLVVTAWALTHNFGLLPVPRRPPCPTSSWSTISCPKSRRCLRWRRCVSTPLILCRVVIAGDACTPNTLPLLTAAPQITGRAVVLPTLWCGMDRWWAPHAGIIPGSGLELPYLCPADHVLDLEA